MKKVTTMRRHRFRPAVLRLEDRGLAGQVSPGPLPIAQPGPLGPKLGIPNPPPAIVITVGGRPLLGPAKTVPVLVPGVGFVPVKT